MLLEEIDYDFNRKEVNKQRAEEESMLQGDDDEDSRQSEAPPASNSDDDSESNHEQWGNFEEPEATTSTAPPKAKKRPAKLITAGERDLLRDEFRGVMYGKFLSGEDSEFFDYATVDANEEYDDTLETDQDYEDKYFEEDSEDTPAQQVINEDTEDELDVYMKHLERNLKQQQQNGFEEEFDDDP